MKKRIKILGFSILGIILIFFTFFIFFPGIIIKSSQAITKIKARVIESEVKTGTHTWSYLQGGVGDTIVFIHGFPDDKFMWLNYVKYFTGSYHVIIPDLPGFGKTMHDPENEYQLDNITYYLNEFFNSMDIKHAHLVGISMGGAIVLKYAHAFPKNVNTIIAMNPLGISSDNKSRFQKYVDDGYIPFVFQTTEDFDLTMELIFNESIYIPKQFKKWYIKKTAPRVNLYTKMVNQEIEKNGWNSIDTILAEINKPVLFFWGDSEQVFDVSCTKTIERLMPHAQIEIIESTGHMPIHQEPEMVLDLMAKFLEENK